MTILGLSKKETLWTTVLLVTISLLVYGNLRVSIRRSRDFQRKEDLGNITRIITNFQSRFGTIPASDSDGYIYACNLTTDSQGVVSFAKCPWGEIMATGDRMPVDPQNNQKIRYFYISNSKKFQIFASLESDDEPEFDAQVVARNIACGARICNTGRASEKLPVYISIEEYEKQVQDLEKEQN
ncbi:MAG: hypothetical protein AAB546_03805 [Patescibacteria group bacterium]